MGFIYVLKARLHEIMQKLYSIFKSAIFHQLKMSGKSYILVH